MKLLQTHHQLKPYYNKLPDIIKAEDLFDIICDIVGLINKEFISDVINNKTFNLE